MAAVRILCLDPGIGNFGAVVFEYRNGGWELVAQRHIGTKPEHKKHKVFAGDDAVRRLREVCGWLLGLLDTYEPKLVLTELAKAGAKSSKAAESLAASRAIVVGLCLARQVPVNYCWWDDIKKKLTGNAGASKADIQDWVGEHYPLLFEAYHSTTKQSGWKDEFEHIADAAGVFEVFRDSMEVTLLEQLGRGEGAKK